MKAKQITEAVGAGIKFLNGVEPTDWRDAVDIETLDMSHNAFCILGQVYGDYYTGLVALGLSTDDAIPRGFALDVSQDDNGYPALTETWVKELHERYPTVYGRR